MNIKLYAQIFSLPVYQSLESRHIWTAVVLGLPKRIQTEHTIKVRDIQLSQRSLRGIRVSVWCGCWCDDRLYGGEKVCSVAERGK